MEVQEYVDRMVEQHEKWLNNDGGFYVDFSGKKLHDIDFKKANLRYAKFIGTNLINSDFSRANLKEAYFSRALIDGVKWPEELQFKPMPDLMHLIAKTALAREGLINMSGLYDRYGNEEAHPISEWAIILHPEGRRMADASDPTLAARLLLGDSIERISGYTNEQALLYLQKFLSKFTVGEVVLAKVRGNYKLGVVHAVLADNAYCISIANNKSPENLTLVNVSEKMLIKFNSY